MASDPERPIEKLLRSYAEKRREEAGAPLELHPATRRLLQGEVARRFEKPALRPKPSGGVLHQLWPRVAWGLAGVAGVAAIVLVLIPARTQKPELLAKNESSLKAAPAEERQTVIAADRAPATSAAQLAAGQATLQAPVEPPLSGTLAQSSVPAPEPSSRPTKEPAVRAENGVRRDSLQGLNAPTAPAPTPMPETSVASASGRALAARDLEKASDGAVPTAPSFTDRGVATRYGLRAPTQNVIEQPAKDALTDQRLRFVQTEAKAKALPTDSGSAAIPVLSSFQVEQSGAGLQIIDSDGSVYTGYVQPEAGGPLSMSARTQRPATAGALKLAETKGAPTATTPASAAPQTWSNYFFRVVGTNRTLNQRVVFSGKLVYPANVPLPASAGGGVGGAVFGSAASNALPLLNSRISGKALLDDRREIEINALPAQQ